MRLENTVIVVTGASAGLGKAMAEGFVDEGATVICTARTEGRLREAADSMDGPGRAVPIAGDIQQWDDVTNTIDTTIDRFGTIDVVVNNAALTQHTITGEADTNHVVDIPIDIWDAILDTNLRGLFLVTKAALEPMLEQGSGRVIHISSGRGEEGVPGRAPYVTSKWGLEGFHETVSLELDGTGVESLTFKPPGGGVVTSSRSQIADELDHESASVMTEPGIQLAAGKGENGDRFVATPDGNSLEEY
ncbi:SDR family oxidoreductase [Natrarchaeobius oligotrophus]|uniref:SDR family oxidoreductase n=1 Tax=Natrarchaeobius chitinivorans TaxID=1679083 RepID=A0A3N6MGU1_NATCH|nr:SDR family oxidoreductase [Natrarchaeobius chitinivorans]RQH03304.1 SDR family oxidoreductase [Natrarchaeobius chitinivorans]